MKPFQSLAAGWVFLLLVARVGGYDLYADPVGWLLVLLGVHRLPASFPHRSALAQVGVLALLVSAVLWLPPVGERLGEAEPALAWAANLPQYGWLVLLCHAAATAATATGDLRAARWFRTVLLGGVAVVLLPVLVFGAGLTSVETAAGAAVLLTPLALVVALFSYAGRPWAVAPVPDGTTTG